MFRTVPITDSLVSLVSLDTVTYYDTRLQNFQTRYSFADSNVAASQWLYDKFQEFGLDSVAFDSFPHPENPSSWQRNVVGVKYGDMEPDRVLVIGGHFDSVVYGPGTDPYTWAPGADDNGSGTTGTLEIARVLKDFPTDKTLYFVPFAAEEQGLYGSSHFAEEASNNYMDIVFMLNMDMIGYEHFPPWDVDIETNSSSTDYVDLMGEMAILYTDSIVPELYYTTSGYSDHWSFLTRGYKAVLVIEDNVVADNVDSSEFNWNLHTNYDVVDSLNFPYMREVIQMCLATVLQVSEMPDIPQNLSAQNAGDGTSVILSWSPVSQTDIQGYYIYSRQGTSEYTDTVFVRGTDTTLTGFQEGIPAYFTVSAVDTYGYESFMSNEVSVIPTGITEKGRYPRERPSLVVQSPSFGKITFGFTLPEPLKLDITLYNVSGAKIWELKGKSLSSGKHSFLIPVSNLVSGIYFLRVYGRNFEESRRIILLQ